MEKIIIYREEVPLAHWAVIMVSLLITVLTPTILLEILAIYKEPRALILYLILDIIFIIILLNFRKLVITVDKDYLTASFGIFKKKIKLSDIKYAEPINATLLVYTGMGIRYGGDGSLAYLPRLGEAIRIHFSPGRPFVFSTRNQEQVLALLNQESKHKK